jgi:magnesium-transporting ATPase (P-type)
VLYGVLMLQLHGFQSPMKRRDEIVRNILFIMLVLSWIIWACIYGSVYEIADDGSGALYNFDTAPNSLEDYILGIAILLLLCTGAFSPAREFWIQLISAKLKPFYYLLMYLCLIPVFAVIYYFNASMFCFPFVKDELEFVRLENSVEKIIREHFESTFQKKHPEGFVKMGNETIHDCIWIRNLKVFDDCVISQI